MMAQCPLAGPRVPLYPAPEGARSFDVEWAGRAGPPWLGRNRDERAVSIRLGFTFLRGKPWNIDAYGTLGGPDQGPRFQH